MWGEVVKNERSLILIKADILKLFFKDKHIQKGTPSEIWLGVPLKLKDEAIGVMAIQSYDYFFLYNQRDLNLLNTIELMIESYPGALAQSS